MIAQFVIIYYSKDSLICQNNIEARVLQLPMGFKGYFLLEKYSKLQVCLNTIFSLSHSLVCLRKSEN